MLRTSLESQPRNAETASCSSTCKFGSSCGRITADNIKGVLIIAAKVHARDLFQEVSSRHFVPDRVWSDLEQAQPSGRYAHDTTDLTSGSLQLLAVNRNQRKCSGRGEQERAQAADADLGLARLGFSTLLQR